MSKHNIELVRRGYEAWNRGGVEAIIEILDPGIEWKSPSGEPTAREVYRGHKGVREWACDWEGLFENHYEPERFFDAGHQLLVFVRWRGRHEDSGQEFEQAIANVWTIHDGRVTALRVYLDRGEALTAIGLDPPGQPPVM